jgi:hypothetical protein
MPINFDVRFTPESGLLTAFMECPLCATSCREQLQYEREASRSKHGRFLAEFAVQFRA